MLLCQLMESTLQFFIARVHEKCYLGNLRDVIGSYVRQKGITDLVTEIIFRGPQVMFLKPNYQR